MMHVGWLMGSRYARREALGLSPLVVGLMDESVRLTRLVPVGVEPPGGDLAGPVLATDAGGWWWSRRGHRHRLAEALREQDPHLLHALDGERWEDAVALGEMLDVPVILSARGLSDVRSASRRLRQVNPTRLLLTAPTEPLARELRETTSNLLRVETVLPGVHTSDNPPPTRSPDHPLCLMLSSDAPLDDGYADCLAGLAEFCQSHPATQCFIEGELPDAHSIWKLARRLELASHLSFVPGRLAKAPILLSAHALIHPQPIAEPRSITLLAMGHALPVVAVVDPMLDYLVPDHTARLIGKPSPQHWLDHFHQLADDPTSAADLGRRARAWVHEERLATDHVERILSLYRQLAGEPIAFVG